MVILELSSKQKHHQEYKITHLMLIKGNIARPLTIYKYQFTYKTIHIYDPITIVFSYSIPTLKSLFVNKYHMMKTK